MKFGKALQETSERFPKMPFMRYKLQKQMLKCFLLENDSVQTATQKQDDNEAPEIRTIDQFVQSLNQDVRALNMYFIGKEEELVIRMQDLETAAMDLDSEDRSTFVAKLVKFHGDIILLLHWQNMNYTGFSKILKKHDKLVNGVPLRKSFLKSLSHQPFYSKELLERLSRQCESLINKLVPMETLKKETPVSDLEDHVTETTDISGLSKMHYALRTWRDLGDNAHTPSTVLPYSKPIPEDMKIWVNAENDHFPKSKSNREIEQQSSGSDTSSDSSISEQQDKETNSPIHLSKRSHSEVSVSELDAEKVERVNKIARNND